MATVESAERLVSLPTVIETRLQDVRRRESRLRLMTGLIDATALFLFVMLGALICDWAFTLFSTQMRLVLTLGTVVAGVIGLLLLAFVPQLKRRSLAEVAADVDRSVSALQERWQTVAELSTSKDPAQVVGSPAMARRVVREAVAREKLVDSRVVVTSASLKKHQWFLVAAIAAHVVLFAVDPAQAWVLLQRFVLPTSKVSLTQVTAVGGNFAVPHGEPVRLEANVARRTHDEAELFLRDASGKVTTVTLAAADKAGSKFVYPIDAADKGFEYSFCAGDGETPWHAVSVHERPTFSKIDFRIVSPEYTKLPIVEKQELPRKLRAVEGSELEIVFTADQPLDQFRLDFGKDESTMLEPSATNAQQYLYRTTLTKTIRLTPVMTSRYGLENVRPPSCQLVVYQDRAPQVQIITPENEISVRPDEQVTIELAARDDFAVMEAELITYVGDAPDMENALIIDAPAEAPATTPDSAHEPAATEGQPVEGEAVEGQQDATPTTGETPSAEITTTPPAEGQVEPGKESPATTTNEVTDPAATNTVKPADGSTDAKPSEQDAKPSAADAKPTEGASNNPSPASPNKSANDNKPGANSANANANPTGNQNQNSSQASPPQTVVTRIPLGNQKGEKNIRAKVKLDIAQFKLKTGQQVQYKVRVVDSRNTAAQNRAQRGMSSDPAATGPLAQNNPRQPGQPSNATPDAKNAQANAANNAQQPNAQNPDGTNSAAKSNGSQNNAQTDPNAQANASQARQPGSPNNNNNGNNNGANNNAQNPSNPQDAQNAGDPSAPGSAQSANNNPNAQNEPSSASGDQSKPSSKSSDQQNPSQGSMTGAPQPQNPMARRELDVEQQSSSSSTMKIHIDEWAGSFKQQQREKLEILIDPILKELDAVLAKSLEHMAPPAEALNQSKPLDDELNKSLKAADTQIERGQTLVADLVKKTGDTPYAFIGLQLVDITELHVIPARGELKAVGTDPADKQQTHVNQAQFHVIRAREMLVNLTKKYEEAKQNAKLADKMDRIRKMYQIFIEDSMAFLAASQDTLNPKSRKTAELELDEEFLEKYTELQKQWNEILKQLAKALADDPRLLERYMNVSRRSAMTLRDQLTVINQRQQLLVPVTDKLIGKDSDTAKSDPEAEAAEGKEKPAKEKKEQPAAAEIVQGSLQKDLAEVSTKAAEIQEDLKTWLPKAVNVSDERVAPLLQQSTRLATTAEQAAAAAELQSLEAAEKKVAEMNTQMTEFEASLTKLSADSDAALAANANRRLAALRRLQLRTSAWAEKNTYLKEGNLNRAIEVDQHRLSEDTLELAGKLDGLQAQLAALPQDVLELAGSLQEILRFDALVDEMQAELTLRDDDLPVARDHQQNAVRNLTRAEETFDKLIDRVIEEQDKVPPEVPDVDEMQLPTLEELLAQLENEQDLAEALGIPIRPTNLQQMRDWLMRNSGNMASGNVGAQRVQTAQQNAMRAVQNANVPEGEKLPTKKVGRWNTLSSRLEDILRQGRGKLPPKQYQRAIDQYFEDISGAEGAEK